MMAKLGSRHENICRGRSASRIGKDISNIVTFGTSGLTFFQWSQYLMIAKDSDKVVDDHVEELVVSER